MTYHYKPTHKHDMLRKMASKDIRNEGNVEIWRHLQERRGSAKKKKGATWSEK